MHKRNLLLLMESETMQLAHEVLGSPLDLAKRVICRLFEGTLLAFKEDLDVIKEFAAGTDRATKLN